MRNMPFMRLDRLALGAVILSQFCLANGQTKAPAPPAAQAAKPAPAAKAAKPAAKAGKAIHAKSTPAKVASKTKAGKAKSK